MKEEIAILEVDDDCNITYSDGKIKPCEQRPHYTFSECAGGYGGRGCPKYNLYHRVKS